MLYISLENYLTSIRDDFESYKKDAINLCGNKSYDSEIKNKRWELHFDEKKYLDDQLEGKQKSKTEAF